LVNIYVDSDLDYIILYIINSDYLI